MEDNALATLRDMLDRSRRAVVFTGAGISTESGIPDFRSPGGIWTQMAPIDFEDFLASEETRRESWRRRFAMERPFGAAEPNRGHRAVAQLVRAGQGQPPSSPRTSTGCTRPRASRRKVIELHGNTTYAHCLDCGHATRSTTSRAAFERDGAVPRCARLRRAM